MAGESEEGVGRRILEFFRSGVIDVAPFNVIASCLWASLAASAAAGQKKVPDEGTPTDIEIVSTLLPYCDAMLIDNGTRALFNKIPSQYRPKYPCQVFSPNDTDSFLAYLKGIRDAADDWHVRTVVSVYGEQVLRANRRIHGVGGGQ
jgi:hypothetical protein